MVLGLPEYGQVALVCRTYHYRIGKRHRARSSVSTDMHLQTMIVGAFGGIVAFGRNAGSYPGPSFVSAGDHRHRVGHGKGRVGIGGQMVFDKDSTEPSKDAAEAIDPVIECLIGRQQREPAPQVVTGEAMNIFDLAQPAPIGWHIGRW